MGCINVKLGGRQFNKCYSMGPQLGNGAFGAVHVGLNSRTKQTVAIKIMNTKGLDPHDLKTINDEVAVLKMMNHPHIIQCYDFFKEVDRYLLVLELCDGGDLLDKIAKKKTYHEQEARELTALLLEAVAYIHERNVVHRDLKPENLLLTSSNDDSTIKIADFGVAERLKEPDSLNLLCGTPGYMAPEIIKGENYGLAVDMWSVGVIMFVLLGGYMPFNGSTQQSLFARIAKGKAEWREKPWDEVSTDAKELILALLNVDPKRRLTARQALQQRWMRAPSHELYQRDLHCSLTNIKGFNARRKFKAAADVVRMSSRLMKSCSNHSLVSECSKDCGSVKSLRDRGCSFESTEDSPVPSRRRDSMEEEAYFAEGSRGARSVTEEASVEVVVETGGAKARRQQSEELDSSMPLPLAGVPLGKKLLKEEEVKEAVKVKL